MRILIIRHGEPDYAHDCLTEKGWREAQYLAKRLAKEQIDWFYVSPMGRAQQTASCTLQAMNREAETLDWLREFQVPVIHTGDTVPTRPWDWIPSVWVKDERFFDKDGWTQNPAFEQVDVNLIYAARTLGMSEISIFFRVIVPCAKPGILSGTILTFARAMGEYGATSMLAGNIPGRTATISQKVAMVMQDQDYLTAGIWVAVIVIISFGIIFLLNYVTMRKEHQIRKW